MRLAVFAVALLFASPALAQEDEPSGDRADRGDRGSSSRSRGDSNNGKVKPYDKVITDAAESKRGVFMVHKVGDNLFYEIPTDAFGDEFLWVTQIAKTQSGHGYGGTSVGNRVVRWELRDETVLLRDVKYGIRADVDDSVKNSVAATNLEPIIKTFAVAAWGKDRAPVIDVTSLFTTDITEFSAARRLGASSMDKSRTFLEEFKAFPTNLETKILATYKKSSAPTTGRRFGRSTTDPTQSAVTALVHHSMVKLPDDPMRPRRHDDRVGFFNVSFEDYGTDEHQVDEVKYITRWRLEKKDPDAAVSETKKPIVFYVGRGVPERWRPWVKKGIEAWAPAFEAAGFKDAIVAKDAPSVREDPDWDAEDARISSIRWLPSTIENAMGPHVSDPRTGEILEADIVVYHNILKLVRDWYFVQVSPMDERAQKLPLPDDLVGELLAYVITHEVGHSLGFPHNMKASSAYTVQQLRDPEFTAKNGNEASIMDYGRFNYVAQPGDGARLIPVVGPYDFFAVDWGYRELPRGASLAKERAALEELVARQVDDPVLRFGDPNPALDPSQQTEDLGSDPIAATTLGLKNIERIAGFLVEATCVEGEDYSLLRNMYDQLLGQRDREFGHVVSVVGGMVAQNLRFGDADRVFTPIESAKQRAAVKFLVDNAFQTPAGLLDPNILDRLEASGAADRVLRTHQRVLGGLVNETRVMRMAEYADRAGDDAYTPAQMLADVRDGVWSDLGSTAVEIDLYRRNLQRAHVDTLSKFVDALDVNSDLPALCRSELETLLNQLGRSTDRAADPVTRSHLVDLSARIDRALEPRSVRESEPAGGPAAATSSHESRSTAPR